jgi:hypothetical protein
MSDVIYTDESGKRWKVVAVRQPKACECIILRTGSIRELEVSEQGIHPIVEPLPLPLPRRVPTDQDAAVWPRRKCWVRDDLESKWSEKATLLYVQSDASFPFITSDGCWRYCEIEDETPINPPSE